jgi:hypothetical protein
MSLNSFADKPSDEEAFFLVTTPEGRVIASLGGLSRQALPRDPPIVREALSRFPAQVSGFLARDDRLFHITITPVYIGPPRRYRDIMNPRPCRGMVKEC